MAQRRNFGKALKAKVAIEAIKGVKTVNEIASIYEVHPNQVSLWKKHALERLPDAMADGRTKQVRDKKPVDEEKLHQKIGQQAVEIDFLKKKIVSVRITRRLEMMDNSNNKLSIRKQCDLLGVNRSRVYYQAVKVSERVLSIMNFLDTEFTAHPFTGVPRMVEVIQRKTGIVVNHKRIRRLMRQMGLMALYPKPRTTQSIIEQAKYPCLIRPLDITGPDQVWCSDITYIRMLHGFMYLVAIMDYFSRYVLSWAVSNSLESLFCMDALDEALRMSHPEMFHSDQGCQYTCSDFTGELKDQKIKISMSGRGRCFDNILAERLWRTVKYEEVYLREYGDGHELIRSLRRYFEYYNDHRPHMSLDYQTPAEVYHQNRQLLRSAPATPPLRQATELNTTLQLTP